MGAASCDVELSGEIPDGAMMSVRSYPKGNADIAYDKGTVQKFLTSVTSGTNSITFNDPDEIVEGTILVAYLIQAGEPVAQSKEVTVKKVPAPEVSIKGKITPESTTVPVAVKGAVPEGAKIILFTFDADATEFPRDYSVGSFLASYTESVSEGTTKIPVENLEKGRQVVAFLVDGSWNDVAQSAPVSVTEQTEEPSIALGEITTSSETVDVTITGALPEGSMVLIKSYSADVTEYSYTAGNPHGVTPAENVSAGTFSHTLTNTDNLIKGRKVVAFILNGGSPIAASEPVVITQGAYMTPEVQILDKEITAGDTKLNFSAAFDKALDSATYTVYTYTGDQFDKASAEKLTSATLYRSGSNTVYIAGKIKAGDKLVVVLTVEGEDHVSDPITVAPSPDWGTPTAAFTMDSISDEAAEIPIKVDYADEYTQMEDFYCNISVYMFDKSVDDDVFEEDEYWEKTDKVSVVARANASSGDATKGEFKIKVLDSANLQAGKKLIIKLRLPHPEWEGEEQDFLSSSIQIQPASQIARGPSVLLYHVDFGSERGQKIKALLDENKIAYKVVDDTDLNQTIGYLAEKKGYAASEKPYTGGTYDTEFMLMNDADETELYKVFVDDGAFLDKMTDAGVSIPHKAIITATNQEWTLAETIETITEEHAVMTNWVALNNLAETAEKYSEERYGGSENWDSYQQILSKVSELLKEEEPSAEALETAYQQLTDEMSALTADEATTKALQEDLTSLEEKASGYSSDTYGNSANWEAFKQTLSDVQALLKESEPKAGALQLAYEKLNKEISKLKEKVPEETPSTTEKETPQNTSSTTAIEKAGQTTASKKAKVVKGKSYKYYGQTYKVVKVASGKKAGTVTFTKAKNAKAVTVPKTIKLADKKTYKVTAVGAKAFTAKKIRTVTIGANVAKLSKNAFAKSKAVKVIVKTRRLKKASVKGCLKSSKVKTIQVKVGSKKVNKKFVKAYKKIFTKKIAGRTAAVK